MKKHLLLLFSVLMIATVGLESCSGRRSRARARERERDRSEQSSSRRDRSRNTDTGKGVTIGKNSAEYIQEVAQGEDYDRMLALMQDALGEMKSVSKKYFAGNLSDADAENMVKEITERYDPVREALEKAESEGKLNYNQHKKQMRLLGDFLKTYNAIINRVSNDLEKAFR